MAITAAMVKELREMTGAGMMDCKKALTEADGNMEKAVEVLREKGLAASAKKAGRIASEGMVEIFLSEDNKVGAIVEVNSETDFVAKNQVFRDYVAAVAKQAAESTAADIDAFFEEKWALDTQFTVKEALSQQVAVIGENLNIRRFERYTKAQAGKLVSYIHGAGDPEAFWTAERNLFLESMADAAASVVELFKGQIVYVNVMKNMSVDCDCCAVAEDPCIADIGILVSTDPIAIDQACVDLVYACSDEGKPHLIERIESRNGIHTVEAAAELGFGSREYELITV